MLVRFLVRGRVQGVGFRAWTLRHARALALRGTVRNVPDGSVEVVAEGAEDTLEKFRQLLRRGPTFAHVTDVSELEPGPAQIPETFEITH